MEKIDAVANLTDHLEDFAEMVQTLLVNLTQKGTNVASAAIMVIIILVAGLFVLLLGGIALSYGWATW